MPNTIDHVIRNSAARLDHHIAAHRGNSGESLLSHVKKKRLEVAAKARARKLVYLDTNAWKCMADFRQGKTSLTPAMNAFGESLERAARSDAFAFPVGMPTFFELDSITVPATRKVLTELIDDLSQGICIVPFHDRIGIELRRLRQGTLETGDGLEDFLCSPIELFGIPTVSLPDFVQQHVDEVTFNKAFFDTLSELPLSAQLEMAYSAPGSKWDNSKGIASLNRGKIEHQKIVGNLNTGIFIELRGCIHSWFEEEKVDLGPKEIGLYALEALHHWNQVPDTKACPVLRVLSSIYGLMRFDPHRRYKDGDPNDFMVAASALPVADALFTDRKLANLLSDQRIGLKNFTNCNVISGFEDMAEYLADASEKST